ncbi:hypothetical protein LJK88_17580 [Paenibacillus sp. P26]|nr:hypothetical protein LJK88_17580 [Paenibacillus sp. P26]
MTTGARRLGIGLLSLLLSGLIFWVPFYFVIINSFKNTTESSQFNMGAADDLPSHRQLQIRADGR